MVALQQHPMPSDVEQIAPGALMHGGGEGGGMLSRGDGGGLGDGILFAARAVCGKNSVVIAKRRRYCETIHL